jgi:predicted peptidase
MLIPTLLVASMLCGEAPKPQEFANLFEAHETRYSGGKYKGQLFKYRLFVPRDLNPAGRYPLIVWLHGIGEAGEDNRLSLKYLDNLFNDRDNIEKYQFFMLVVQCPSSDRVWLHSFSKADSEVDPPDEMLTVTLAILRKIMEQQPIDPDRVYVSGLSSGGVGCLELAMRHPETFAAVVPMSAGHPDLSRAAKLTNIPIWAVVNRGERNDAEPIIAAVKNAGGAAYLMVLDGGGHDSWSATLKNPPVWEWLLAQRRGAWACWTPPPMRPWQWWHILTVPVIFLV